MRATLTTVLGLLLAAAAAGCRREAAPPPPKPGPPPLHVSFRKSQIPTEGQVACISNSSESETIKVVAVFVQGKKEKEERSYRLDQDLKPLDSTSVGWARFGGWKLKSGDKLRVRCAGYAGDLSCEVTE